jgi:2-amino-4-hydroxy-6-hydroxymethyldihydropteridine diphosphokinase
LNRSIGLARMADCLIGLGSNLGDRGQHLRQACDALAALPDSQLVSRSRWHASTPVGGPAGQGGFLNAAALLSTSLSPTRLLAELQRIEAEAGRTAGECWAARPLDLDLVLYEGVCSTARELTLPHPRMTYRRFVLEPAVEIAPWLLHAESGWTVQRLLRHLNVGADVAAVIADSSRQTIELVDQLSMRLARSGDGRHNLPIVAPWTPPLNAAAPRPKLILAMSSATGINPCDRHKMLELPATGPVAWIGGDAALHPLDEAVAAIHAVWLELTATPRATN